MNVILSKLGWPAALALSLVASTAWAGTGPSIPINYGHTGTYFEPSMSGQGVLMEVVPESNTLVVSWFTYLGAQELSPDPGGAAGGLDEQRWYFAQGAFAEGDHVVDLQILQPLGGRFATAGATSFPVVGNLRVSFDSCDSGELLYAFTATGFSGQIPLTRLFADGICQQFLGE